jgi:DNA-binding transcriptional MerR regulator
MSTAETLSISDAGAATGLSPHTLRYYERAGLIDPVGRAESSHRRYTETEIEWVSFLTKLRSTGMPIRRMRDYEHRLAVRAQLEEARRNLRAIESKIEMYKERIS